MTTLLVHEAVGEVLQQNVILCVICLEHCTDEKLLELVLFVYGKSNPRRNK